jgi:hypothetical protein
MLNLLKCIVSVEEAKYSGYLVSHLGIEAAPKMVEAVLEMNSPRDHREIKKLARNMVSLISFVSKLGQDLAFFKLLRSWVYCKGFHYRIRKKKCTKA